MISIFDVAQSCSTKVFNNIFELDSASDVRSCKYTLHLTCTVHAHDYAISTPNIIIHLIVRHEEVTFTNI
eukprot:m.258472 g.258472  ORF g.258472 m.258472 type:complete len:70 (-) comp19644_c0_seq2:190-399(-)